MIDGLVVSSWENRNNLSKNHAKKPGEAVRYTILLRLLLPNPYYVTQRELTGVFSKWISRTRKHLGFNSQFYSCTNSVSRLRDSSSSSKFHSRAKALANLKFQTFPGSD